MLVDQELDVKGLKCPLPILRTKKVLAQMDSGQLLRVYTTDPGSQRDFAVFARQSGNALLATNCESAIFEFILRRK